MTSADFISGGRRRRKSWCRVQGWGTVRAVGDLVLASRDVSVLMRDPKEEFSE